MSYSLWLILVLSIINHICLFKKQIKCVPLDFQCLPDHVKCADGLQCIRTKDLCDGYTQCNDGSDESKETCEGLYISILVLFIAFFNIKVVLCISWNNCHTFNLFFDSFHFFFYYLYLHGMHLSF